METGQFAPDFSLYADDGGTFTLSEESSPIILYFYPKDNTPGCTKQAVNFSSTDLPPYRVVGVSKDSVESHRKFKEKHDISITLLSDPEGKVCELYGVWQKKKNYGKEYFGIVRSTFIIDTEKKIIKKWSSVQAAKHIEQISSWLSKQE